MGVQVQATNPAIAATYSGNRSLPANFDDTLTVLNPQIYSVDKEGQITRKLELPSEVENSNVAIVPTIRNWNGEDVVSIDRILANRERRERHAAMMPARTSPQLLRIARLRAEGLDEEAL